MCGIVGILNRSESSLPITNNLIVTMRDTMIHRGPDGEGAWISPQKQIGFGHRRLSIIDLSDAGAQPMHTPDGRYSITFNGEIYNHLSLRAELEKKGFRYRSQSDTETVLYAFAQWGPACLERFEGMWAFAIWDEKEKHLFLSRDRIGIKPLYFSFPGGSFVFASEIKALLKHPALEKDIEPFSLYHYLSYMVPPAPFTMFKGVFKIPAGHTLSLRSDREPELTSFWDATQSVSSSPALSPSELKDERGLIERLKKHLSDSIEKRMMSDVPFGVFLSGGVDSSTNVALMAQHMSRPVNTFTVAFKDKPKFNELVHARKIQKQFNTNHHEILIDEKDLLEYIPNLIHSQDEPLADPVCVPLYFLSKLAREQGTYVIQVGEGSDEIFSGYRWCSVYERLHRQMWPILNKIPLALRKTMLAAGAPFIHSHSKFALAHEWLRRSAAQEPLCWGGAIAFLENAKQRYVTDSLKNAPCPEFPFKWNEADSFADTPLHSGRLAQHYLQKFTDAVPGSHYLQDIMYLELKQRLPELLLMRVDKVTMSTSVEARVPFLDHALVEFAMGLPADMRIRGGTTKYLLKKAVEGLIPDEIINRPKQGFAAPVEDWTKTRLGEVMEDSLHHTRLKKRGLLHFELIEQRMRKRPQGESRTNFASWNMFNLIQWYDHWIDPPD